MDIQQSSNRSGEGTPLSFSVDEKFGLSSEVAARLLAEHGPNELTRKKQAGPLQIFIRQFQSTVVYLLLAAAALSFWMHEPLQAMAILVAVSVNAIVGFITELQAGLSLNALESMAGPTARVLRDGVYREIPAREVVPGDFVLLEAGSRVPADLNLVEAVSLSVEESMLSGESVPVLKSADPTIEPDSDSQENSRLAYQGTLVVSGRGAGLVTGTGDSTRLGHLGKMLSETVSTRTPLENQLEKLGQQLTLLTTVLCGIVLLVGLIHENEIWLMLQTSVALAVAAIPEGMPVVATLALAAGTRRMVAAGALIRQIAAVETLGCTTVICSDKTGTLTENQMLVTDLILPCGRDMRVTGRGYKPVGEIIHADTALSEPGSDNVLMELLRAAALCNDAKVESHVDEEDWHVHGDPTEGALLVAASKIGLSQEKLKADYPRIFEIPFDLGRKRMTTIHQGDEGLPFAAIKGAPGSVLALCTHMGTAKGTVEITGADRQWIESKNLALADRGLRVLAIATKTLSERQLPYEPDKVEANLVFRGLIAMADQPRAGVEEAISHCHQAGIKVMMVTGDQLATANAIGRALKISEVGHDSSTYTGVQLSEMTPDQMRDALSRTTVLARVAPEMKLAIVQQLQQLGEIVAMTGDGVNDAPALRQANIGVAMGRSGTALAREASKMVLTDDNFASIVKAVEQGRIIYANIQRAIAYLLTASLASVLAVFLPVLFATELPMSPLQILWLNIIMHVFPGLAIVLQPADAGIMNQKPRDVKEHLLTPYTMTQILMRSMVVACASLVVIFVAQHNGIRNVSTLGFSSLSFSLLLQAWAWALDKKGPFWASTRQMLNPAMFLNMSASYLLLAGAVYFKPISLLLNTYPLPVNEVEMVVAAGFGSTILTTLLGGLIAALIARKRHVSA